MFVLYYMYGISGPSLLTESIDSMILRYKSKFRPVKPIASTHSAYPCKDYIPKFSHILHELDYLCFFLLSV